ncbi:MAG TPA: hypothetical protein VIK75_00550, partial [Calditerricola sp.]
VPTVGAMPGPYPSTAAFPGGLDGLVHISKPSKLFHSKVKALSPEVQAPGSRRDAEVLFQ